jgi:pilus assembly protein CpaC
MIVGLLTDAWITSVKMKHQTILIATAIACLCAITDRRASGQESVDRFIQRRTASTTSVNQQVQRRRQHQSRQTVPVRNVQYETLQATQPGNRRRLRQITSPEYKATIRQHHSQLVMSEQKIARIAVTSPDIVNFVQYSEKEVALIGLSVGSTDLTLWFENDPNPVMYEITVTSGTPKASSPHGAIVEVGQKLRTVFPRSRVQLIPVADQIVVKGQAYDATDAEQIMRILESQFGGKGKAVVNMMRIPGEAQVLLKVQIAELSRTQLRKLGVSCRDLLERGQRPKSFGPTTAGISGVFENRDVTRMMRWLSSNGTVSYLAEPSLTVLSGHSASFLSGGEYAVPTIVQNGEKHTEFKKYGTRLDVMPTILDRDLIRLKVAPEFSQVDDRRTVDGVPGTNIRRVETVVELREGQTIAIGGLISRQLQTQVGRKPGLRPKWFSRHATEADTELLIVVTPEIVRPMDPTEVPPMPNYYVTHPSDADLFEAGMSEGHPQPSGAASGLDFSGIPIGVGTMHNGYDEMALPPQTMPSNQPASILPAEIHGGPAFNPIQHPQPSSGSQLFEIPTGPGQIQPVPSMPNELPAPPSAPGVRPNDRPAHIYPPSLPPSSASRVPGSVIRPRRSVVESKAAPLPFVIGHSQPRDSQVERKPTSTVTKAASVIRQVGLERPVSQLPPIGHSLPTRPGTSRSTQTQGQR